VTAVLEIDTLTLEIADRHGSATAVAGISLAIARGEILGIVGESGAGKSIIGTAVLRLLKPPIRQTSGVIRLNGARIDEIAEPAMQALRGRHIGAVFQDPLTSLNPLLTIGQHLIQVLTTHLPITRAEALRRARQLLSEVGIPAASERLRSYPHHLSGGMRQRVVLALAFACEPDLVIADEPTAALDVSVQAQVIGVLKDLCLRRGTGIMLITHDMGVIAEAAHRVAVLYAGRIVEAGPTDAVLTAPLHPYSRGLMASIPPVHRLPGLRREAGELPQIDGAMPRPGALPGGCAFHPRCPVRIPRCETDAPGLVRVGASEAACWVTADG
jgi:peptide/nickel transport system ATP-binding protein